MIRDGARDHEPLGDALAIGATEYVAGWQSSRAGTILFIAVAGIALGEVFFDLFKWWNGL